MRPIHRLAKGLHLGKLPPGYHPDGGGLYLRVKEGGTRSWIFRFTISKRPREAGLGAFPAVTLEAARKIAAAHRELVEEGVDPIAKRHAARETDRLNAAQAMTFRQCAQSYISTFEPTWKNSKHRAQWRSTLATYAYPIIGNMDVFQITTTDVMRVIKPLWNEKTETASRLRGRIESIIDSAYAEKEIDRANPARWRGKIELLLPPKSRVSQVKHHLAMPYCDVPKFIARLRKDTSTSARALEFTILTASRTQELIQARFDEFDLKAKVWTVPLARLKVKRGKTGKDRTPHQVPLSPGAIAIIKQQQRVRQNEFVFPGMKTDTPLSTGSMDRLLERMGLDHVATVHGFRSSFRDWVGEETEFPRDLAEMALAHAIESEVEAAYRRGQMLERRRPMMDAWCCYLADTGSRGMK